MIYHTEDTKPFITVHHILKFLVVVMEWNRVDDGYIVSKVLERYNTLEDARAAATRLGVGRGMEVR